MIILPSLIIPYHIDALKSINFSDCTPFIVIHINFEPYIVPCNLKVRVVSVLKSSKTCSEDLLCQKTGQILAKQMIVAILLFLSLPTLL